MKADIVREEERTLVLTGASRGIGHATVKRFSSAGWRVITCSRHAFPENCPWAAGPEDHIQVDLSDAGDTRARCRRAAIDLMLASAPMASSTPWSTMPRSSPKGADGAGSAVLDDRDGILARKSFEVNLFATIWLAQGLKERAGQRAWRHRQRHLHRGSRVHPFAGAAYATSKAALAALTRETGGRFRTAGRARQRHRPG